MHEISLKLGKAGGNKGEELRWNGKLYCCLSNGKSVMLHLEKM